ncbi:MAG: phage portal protein [Prevotellaceae bacterium]|nr:phage portal protein [Prevotellaceae bacterium]
MKLPFFNREILIRRQEKRDSDVAKILADPTLMIESRSAPMLLSTVYRCVDLISDSIAVLPLETYRIDGEGFKTLYKTHPAYNLLDLEPNENMTRFTFFKTIMTSVLLTGNGYAYIERDERLRPLQLIYIPSGQCSVVWIIDADGVRHKRYQISSQDYKFTQLVEPKDMIHVLNFSYDGITGVSTLTHARQTLSISTDSEAHASGFFRSGGNVSGIIKVEAPRLTTEQKDNIYSEWERRTNPVTGRPNGIVALSQGASYQPISVNPKDAQLLESRQFNVIDICRFFSVSPVKAFDLSKSSYSTIEASQLAYLTDTALAIITKIELEINRKVFLPSERGHVKAEFNTSTLLRTDKAAQAAYNREMFNTGAKTPNEIRRENNLPRIKNGDSAFLQINMQPIEHMVRPNENN